MLQNFSGASVKRVIDRSCSCVPEHAHDWPVLSLFVIGSFENETELGKQLFCGPSAIFYRAGAAHRNTIGADGSARISTPRIIVIELPGARPARRAAASRPLTRFPTGCGTEISATTFSITSASESSNLTSTMAVVSGRRTGCSTTGRGIDTGSAGCEMMWAKVGASMVGACCWVGVPINQSPSVA